MSLVSALCPLEARPDCGQWSRSSPQGQSTSALLPPASPEGGSSLLKKPTHSLRVLHAASGFEESPSHCCPEVKIYHRSWTTGTISLPPG